MVAASSATSPRFCPSYSSSASTAAASGERNGTTAGGRVMIAISKDRCTRCFRCSLRYSMFRPILSPAEPFCHRKMHAFYTLQLSRMLSSDETPMSLVMCGGAWSHTRGSLFLLEFIFATFDAMGILVDPLLSPPFSCTLRWMSSERRQILPGAPVPMPSLQQYRTREGEQLHGVRGERGHSPRGAADCPSVYVVLQTLM